MRTWRGRFAAGGMPALADRKRSGRPVSFTALQVAEAKALACQLPAETGVGLPGRLRRPSRPCLWPLRTQDRHQALHEPGHPSHDHRALRQCQTRLLDRRQRLIPPREEGHRSLDQGVSERCHGPHPRARLLDEPDRYNATAQPFQWRFTTSDLDDLLARLDRHTLDRPEESSARLTA
ncbi:helix-turn-helix domain-containing protein [Streptomyces sp. NPDC090119]|uniref:helix-turn-helix domain-containing protein n=1 Tax=Streptomyces sp. NPDC090119 TaxID=3365951 RepID=UPI00382380F7